MKKKNNFDSRKIFTKFASDASKSILIKFRRNVKQQAQKFFPNRSYDPFGDRHGIFTKLIACPCQCRSRCAVQHFHSCKNRNVDA
ncbi:hypothetical protein T10_4589 [Trichinella papuae]|uniref:Uncharacterized protein n=1 Tax=Trichinella papuae TaxID=268474 RepID=A0A0V1MEI7_9BILA|nr:hypothetical protein T10_4589 [Trichinella papuae]